MARSLLKKFGNAPSYIPYWSSPEYGSGAPNWSYYYPVDPILTGGDGGGVPANPSTPNTTNTQTVTATPTQTTVIDRVVTQIVQAASPVNTTSGIGDFIKANPLVAAGVAAFILYAVTKK